jgi:hypothetical protein
VWQRENARTAALLVVRMKGIDMFTLTPVTVIVAIALFAAAVAAFVIGIRSEMRPAEKKK